MITRDVDGRTALPLRAVPFVSGGELDARLLAERLVAAAGDPKGHPTLEGFVIEKAGTIRKLDPGDFVRMHYELEAARGQPLEQLRQRIPPGVWVWSDMARALHSSIAYDYYDPVAREMSFVFGNWSLDPLLGDADLEFISAGTALVPCAPNAAKAMQGRLLPDGTDPTLKEPATRIAKEIALRLHRTPTRVEVAKQLLAERPELKKKSTAERRIRASWWS